MKKILKHPMKVITLKGCPACHGKPTVNDKGHIICNAHQSDFKVSVYGETLEESIEDWNKEDWVLLGALPNTVISRPNYNIELGQ